MQLHHFKYSYSRDGTLSWLKGVMCETFRVHGWHQPSWYTIIIILAAWFVVNMICLYCIVEPYKHINQFINQSTKSCHINSYLWFPVSWQPAVRPPQSAVPAWAASSVSWGSVQSEGEDQRLRKPSASTGREFGNWSKVLEFSHISQCVRNTSATSDIDDVFSNCPS